MKKLIIFLFVVFKISLYSQSGDKVKYTAETLYLSSMTVYNKEVESRIPYGKDVTLLYDNFFKSWLIKYTLEDGRKVELKWKQLMYVGENINTMLDEENNQWSIINSISELGQLMGIYHKEIRPGLVMIYSIEEIKKSGL